MTIAFSPSQTTKSDQRCSSLMSSDPWMLLWADLKLGWSLMPYFSRLFRPVKSNDPRAELNIMSFGNVVSMCLQLMLLIWTSLAMIGAMVLAFLPVSLLVFTLYFCFAVLVGAICEIFSLFRSC